MIYAGGRAICDLCGRFLLLHTITMSDRPGTELRACDHCDPVNVSLLGSAPSPPTQEESP